MQAKYKPGILNRAFVESYFFAAGAGAAAAALGAAALGAAVLSVVASSCFN
jgi:hypothetical protein